MNICKDFCPVFSGVCGKDCDIIKELLHKPDLNCVGPKLRTMVLEAIGEASMCWEFPEKAGVFQSDRASEIGERLVEEIIALTEAQQDVVQKD